MNKLKAAGIKITAHEIRNSVIINWLKQHNIVQVKYFAGHKYISSTEKYKQQMVEDLQTE